MKLHKTFIASAILAAIATIFTISSCTPKGPKTLILYYSQTGSTEVVAQEIQKQTGADIEKYDVVEKYDGTFEETVQRVQTERATGILPTIIPIQSDLKKYDIIFLGTPSWFSAYSQPLAALLSSTDFSGKKIVPFCSFGSCGIEAITDALKKDLPNSEILPGYGIRHDRIQAAEAELDYFLTVNGYKEGTVTPLPDYSEQRDLTPEEATIFAEATAGYPYPLGEAVSVGSREVEGGTDYAFSVKNFDQEGHEITAMIYVIVREGAKAEFTRVGR